VGVLQQRLELVFVGAGDRELDVGLEPEARGVLVDTDRDRDLGGLAVEAVLLGEQQDGLAKAGRPAEREQLLGIVAFAGAMASASLPSSSTARPSRPPLVVAVVV
jgi:hypothetical protein